MISLNNINEWVHVGHLVRVMGIEPGVKGKYEILYLYLYKYENVCLSVCVFLRVFLCHLKSDWETFWHKAAFRPRMSSKTIKFQKQLFFAELLPFFYISLRFLCKFEERL